MQGRNNHGARGRFRGIVTGMALLAALPVPLLAGQPVIRAIGAAQGVESRQPGEVIQVPRHTVLIRSVNAQTDTVMAVNRPLVQPVVSPVPPQPPQPTRPAQQQDAAPRPVVAVAAPSSTVRAPPPLPPPLPTDPAQMRARMGEAMAALRAGGDSRSPAQQALVAAASPAISERGLVGVRRILPPQQQAPVQTVRAPLKNNHLNAYQAQVAGASYRYGVEEALVRAVIHAESAYNPLAVSRAGAAGLMQLMPGTARTYGVSNRFDPVQNIEGGTRYLSMLLRRYNGNVSLVAAAYNAGEGAVDRYGGIPPYRETKAYVGRVTRLLSSYRAALGGWAPDVSLMGSNTRELAYSPALRAISGN